MRLDDAPESGNVEDRRGISTGMAAGGGGILLLILGLIFGVDFGGGKQPAGGGGDGPPPDPKTKQFAAKILGTLESVWTDEFKKNGYGTYKPPGMVLFSEQVNTGCGTAPSAVGPFYCPADKHLYLDPTFFEELEKKLGGSKGEFSQAYVIAHEVGHHVQNLIGYSQRVDEHRGKRDEKQYSVRLELQADYLAGVWAHHGQKKFNFIEPGDVESAIKSANAIGDDRLQKKSGGFVHPEQFTHGTAKQRVAAFSDGLKTGDASKAKLGRFFDVAQTPFDQSTGEIKNLFP